MNIRDIVQRAAYRFALNSTKITLDGDSDLARAIRAQTFPNGRIVLQVWTGNKSEFRSLATAELLTWSLDDDGTMLTEWLDTRKTHKALTG